MQWVALVPVRWSSTGLMIGALLRAVLLLPILLLVTPSPSQPLIHPGTLAWAIVLVALLGLSNGYFGSLPMIVFSGKLKSPQHLEVAGESLHLMNNTNHYSCYRHHHDPVPADWPNAGVGAGLRTHSPHYTQTL